MQINVAQLLKEPIGTARNFELEDVVLVEGEEAPVYGQVTLVRLKIGILATGSVSASLCQVCSRCLMDFNYSLTIKFEEEFSPVIDVNTGLALEVPEDKSVFTINENHIMDLEELIRQYILLDLPMKPLCREDCPGFCFKCGVNLKDEECSCEKENTDERWTDLLELLVSTQEIKPFKKGPR
ncbi:MAG: DUF177 domain-containing protein [Dehalococcoidia bacterium]|nr:DUF177 domain-containing protein [Dehalococcoidia bacterium]